MNAKSLTAAPRRRRRPSTGFTAVCCVYAAVAVFFAWGLSTPPLDRVWTLHHELKAGRLGAPSDGDRAVLRDAMQRHPTLARALLRDDAAIGLISAHDEGWIARPEATIVRTAAARERALRLEVTTARERLPFTLEARGEGWSERREIRSAGIHELPLPELKGAAELIVISLRGHGLVADPSVLGVRISFGAAGRAS